MSAGSELVAARLLPPSTASFVTPASACFPRCPPTPDMPPMSAAEALPATPTTLSSKPDRSQGQDFTGQGRVHFEFTC